MSDCKADPKDLWTLYDAPYFEDVGNPLVFAAFVRSRSTESVRCSSMFGTIAFRATGPDGGKVTFHAVRSHLEPDAFLQLKDAYKAAKNAGKAVSEAGRLQKSL